MIYDKLDPELKVRVDAGQLSAAKAAQIQQRAAATESIVPLGTAIGPVVRGRWPTLPEFGLAGAEAGLSLIGIGKAHSAISADETSGKAKGFNDEVGTAIQVARNPTLGLDFRGDEMGRPDQSPLVVEQKNYQGNAAATVGPPPAPP